MSHLNWMFCVTKTYRSVIFLMKGLRGDWSKESAEGKINVSLRDQKEHILYSLLLKHHPNETWWKHFIYLPRWADIGQSISEVWCCSPLQIYFNTTIFTHQVASHFCTHLSCRSFFISYTHESELQEKVCCLQVGSPAQRLGYNLKVRLIQAFTESFFRHAAFHYLEFLQVAFLDLF